MEKSLFIDIDTQNDFMNCDGALYIPGAESIKENLRNIIQFAKDSDSYVIAATDAHMPNDPEFNIFPPHCVIRTYGQQKIKETQLADPEIITIDYDQEVSLESKYYLIEKREFDIFSNPHTARLMEIINPETIYIFGVATEICVKAAVVGLINRYPDVNLVIDAVKGLDEQKANEFIDFAVKSNIKIVRTKDVLKGKLCVLH